MSRIGIQSKEELLHLAQLLTTQNNIIIEGVFTHFAEADHLTSEFTNLQFDTLHSCNLFIL